MPLYWTIFTLFSLGHLCTCFLEWETPRKITKVMVVPLLIFGLTLTKTWNPFVLAGLVFGWLGDILLIWPDRKKCFLIGAFFFLLGHFSYICASLQLFLSGNTLRDIPAHIWLLWMIAAVTLMTIAIRKLYKHIGIFACVGAGYFSVVLAALLLSLLARQYLLASAFLVFLVSDSTLSVCQFAKHMKRENFYIMLTYILAQTLICVSYMTI